MTRIIAIVLLAGGILALVYGGFTYPKGTSKTELGPISLVVHERGRVNVPVWAGVFGIVLSRQRATLGAEAARSRAASIAFSIEVW